MKRTADRDMTVLSWCMCLLVGVSAAQREGTTPYSRRLAVGWLVLVPGCQL